MRLTEAQKDLLRHMWEVEDKPASVIGRAFGLSRSAVLGLAHRMSLKPRRVERRAPVQDWAKRRQYWDRWPQSCREKRAAKSLSSVSL